VTPAGLRRRVQDRRGVTACIAPAKEKVFSSECDRAKSAFGGVVIDVQEAVFGESVECDPVPPGIGDGMTDRALRQHSRHLIRKPGRERRELLFRSLLAQTQADRIGIVADEALSRDEIASFILDQVEVADAGESLGRSRGVGIAGLKEVPPRVREASDFNDAAGKIEAVEHVGRVGLQEALVILEDLGRPGASLGRRVIVDEVRMVAVADVDPEPARLGLSLASGQNHPCVVW
jgi:hypothetical protein